MAESELPPFAQATAGACGSLVSNSLVYPLDLLSTRLQTQSKGKGSKGHQSIYGALQEIVRNKGILGLYQGWAADSMSNTMSNFLFFFFRSFLIERLQARKPPAPSREKGKAGAVALSAGEDLAAGMLAGVASRFFTTPLSNVTVRHQTSSTAKEKPSDDAKGKGKALNESDSDDDEGEYSDEPGIIETLSQIVKEKGIPGLWAGYETAILLSVSPALTFYLTHIITSAALPKSSRDKPSSLQTFFVNAAGNAGSTALLFPLILSKTRLQWRSPSGRKMYKSLLDVLRKTVKRNGVSGLYQGLESQLLKGLVSHGTTMVVKQRVEALFVTLFLILRARSIRGSRSAA
ncbi:hypothetical protein CBS101457_002501 [Exobasidium rhododendri]|nr:hypothetical protein CBS101457_002501 [Exobasidium rhododendri]